MTTLPEAATPLIEEASSGFRRLDALRRFGANRFAALASTLLIMLVMIAVLAPLLTSYDPMAIGRERLMPPGMRHFFGTDNVGKDVFAGVLYGTRVSLLVGVLAGLTSLAIGVIVGAAAGYYGGALDSVLMRIAEFVQIMPRFFLAILIVAFFGGGVAKIVLVIGGLGWPEVGRIVRAQFLSLKEREVVEAARAIGFGDRHIIFHEILPNALAPAIVQASLDVSEAILLQAGLAFFGLSNPDMASWGEMLNRAQPFLRAAWWMSVFPGLAIFLTVLCFNLVGDGLNDMLSPEGRER
ncbi:MAG: ABC transporter permease [Hyphomicrobiales bacterium]